MADNAFVTHNRKQGRRASPRPRPDQGYGATRQTPGAGGYMAKRHGRPSMQYRYEHYDPRW